MLGTQATCSLLLKLKVYEYQFRTERSTGHVGFDFLALEFKPGTDCPAYEMSGTWSIPYGYGSI